MRIEIKHPRLVIQTLDLIIAVFQEWMIEFPENSVLCVCKEMTLCLIVIMIILTVVELRHYQ